MCIRFMLLFVLVAYARGETPVQVSHAPAPILPDAPLPARLTNEAPFARWTVEVLAIHDPARGWGAAGRVDYRVSRRMSISAEQSRSITEGGFTMRLGRQVH